MFCIHCGASGAAAFCASCGKEQIRAAMDQQGQREASDCEMSGTWTESIQYDKIISHPDARALIAAATRDASDSVSSNDLLALLDAVSPAGIPLSKLTKVVLPFYDKLGIRTERRAHAEFDAPPGSVLVAVLCALACKSLKVAEVYQEDGACTLFIQTPFELLTNPGRLSLVVRASSATVQVLMELKISGQWYDWGRSARLMDEMFKLINDLLSKQASDQPVTYRRIA